MAYLTGTYLINCPASALNNAGSLGGERAENTVAVKFINAKDGDYPYVSAQAYRYWLRNSVETTCPDQKLSPIDREKKIAYTAADPIDYWDDDLLGYMRAEKSGTLTRVSPFRTSTLVSIAPVVLTNDFGTMSRHEGNPVPHEHQFYRATLKGSVSLNLATSGRFYSVERTGYKNIEEQRAKKAQAEGLEEIKKADKVIGYSLNKETRTQRIEALLKGMANLDGGAKQTLHFTDVAPSFIVMAFVKGGNNIFQNIVTPDEKRLPVVHLEALKEILTVYKEELLSPVYFGWPQGYMDDQRAKVEEVLKSCQKEYSLKHPKEIMVDIIDFLNKNPDCLD